MAGTHVSLAHFQDPRMDAGLLLKKFLLLVNLLFVHLEEIFPLSWMYIARYVIGWSRPNYLKIQVPQFVWFSPKCPTNAVEGLGKTKSEIHKYLFNQKIENIPRPPSTKPSPCPTRQRIDLQSLQTDSEAYYIKKGLLSEKYESNHFASSRRGNCMSDSNKSHIQVLQ